MELQNWIEALPLGSGEGGVAERSHYSSCYNPFRLLKFLAYCAKHNIDLDYLTNDELRWHWVAFHGIKLPIT